MSAPQRPGPWSYFSEFPSKDNSLSATLFHCPERPLDDLTVSVMEQGLESFEKLVSQAFAVFKASLDDVAASCIEQPDKIFGGEIGAHE